ncbi:hypothetical protein ACLOJK_003287 [Asimina triloba]
MTGADTEALEAEEGGEGKLDDEEVEIEGKHDADNDSNSRDLEGDDVAFGLEVEGLGGGGDTGDGGVDGEGGERETSGKG